MKLFRRFSLFRDACGYHLQIFIPSWRMQIQYLYEATLQGIAWGLTAGIVFATLLAVAKAFRVF